MAEGEPAGRFALDTAVALRERCEEGAVLDAAVADGWVAGRGPHGGNIAAMLLKAMEATLADSARAPRSMTIHYARAPRPGPVELHVRIERRGRSLSTLSTRMRQESRTVALVLGAFSVPWEGPEIDDLPLPDVEPAGPEREAGTARRFGAPPFTEHIVMQPRFEGPPLTGERRPMRLGAWLGLSEARPVDAPALAFFSDALLPSPYFAIDRPAAAPTVDLTIHFRTSAPRRDPRELCFVQVASRLVHEGFFEEDGVIWAADGTVLAQSRQLAILL
ncbi:MAG: thioesterase family protein [Solirubrobacteraceae bacterium]